MSTMLRRVTTVMVMVMLSFTVIGAVGARPADARVPEDASGNPVAPTVDGCTGGVFGRCDADVGWNNPGANGPCPAPWTDGKNYGWFTNYNGDSRCKAIEDVAKKDGQLADLYNRLKGFCAGQVFVMKANIGGAHSNDGLGKAIETGVLENAYECKAPSCGTFDVQCGIKNFLTNLVGGGLVLVIDGIIEQAVGRKDECRTNIKPLTEDQVLRGAPTVEWDQASVTNCWNAIQSDYGKKACTYKIPFTDKCVDPKPDFGNKYLNQIFAAQDKRIDSGRTPGAPVAQAGFWDKYQRMVWLASLLMLPMLVLTAVQALFKQNAGELLRAVFIHLPLSAIGMTAGVVITISLMKAVDGASAFMMSTMGTDFNQLKAGMTGVGSGAVGGAVAVGAIASGGTGAGLGALILMGFAALAGFILWAVLIVRDNAIVMALLFLPLSFAAFTFPPAAKWLKRAVEFLLAMIISKLLIVSALSVGISLMAGGGTDGSGQQTFRSLMVGVAAFLTASFSPFAVLKFTQFAEAQVATAMEGHEKAPHLMVIRGISNVQMARGLMTGRPPGAGGVPLGDTSTQTAPPPRRPTEDL